MDPVEITNHLHVDDTGFFLIYWGGVGGGGGGGGGSGLKNGLTTCYVCSNDVISCSPGLYRVHPIGLKRANRACFYKLLYAGLGRV